MSTFGLNIAQQGWILQYLQWLYQHSQPRWRHRYRDCLSFAKTSIANKPELTNNCKQCKIVRQYDEGSRPLFLYKYHKLGVHYHGEKKKSSRHAVWRIAVESVFPEPTKAAQRSFIHVVNIVIPLFLQLMGLLASQQVYQLIRMLHSVLFLQIL